MSYTSEMSILNNGILILKDSYCLVQSYISTLYHQN